MYNVKDLVYFKVKKFQQIIFILFCSRLPKEDLIRDESQNSDFTTHFEELFLLMRNGYMFVTVTTGINQNRAHRGITKHIISFY